MGGEMREALTPGTIDEAWRAYRETRPSVDLKFPFDVFRAGFASGFRASPQPIEAQGPAAGSAQLRDYERQLEYVNGRRAYWQNEAQQQHDRAFAAEAALAAKSAEVEGKDAALRILAQCDGSLEFVSNTEILASRVRVCARQALHPTGRGESA